MELKVGSESDIHTWEEVTLIYGAALKQMNTKIEILNEEFQQVHRYNPIEHIKYRLKTPESIVKKLKKHGYEATIENMVLFVNDIAGFRIICSFESDIYRIAGMLSKQGDIKVVAIKDYIKYPKESGYRSYHMILTVPIYLSDVIMDARVELQIRTVAMDFWASLEHKIRYKFEGNAPAHINTELFECARMVEALDVRMMELDDEIRKLSGDDGGNAEISDIRRTAEADGEAV